MFYLNALLTRMCVFVEKFDLANYTGVDKSRIVGMFNMKQFSSVFMCILVSVSPQYEVHWSSNYYCLFSLGCHQLNAIFP